MNAVRFLRKRLSQIVLVLAWVIFFTLLIPGFLPESIIYSFKSSEIDGQLISFKNEAVNQRLVNVGDSFSKGSTYSLGPLVSFTKIYTLIKTKSDAPPILGSGINIQVDYQRALIVMIVLTVATLTGLFVKEVRRPASTSHIFGHELDDSVDQALLTEAKNAWSTAQRFYGSSLYLLVSGVAMAFLGMVVFVYTITDPAKTGGAWEYAFAALRPFGLLIFIEAIAWFLLRQYRSLTEDFKNFHRIYLRRSNYMIARKALVEIKSFEKSRTIAKELLSEDLSGRLFKGQSTEAIEAMRVDENNPVFKVLTDVLSRAAGKETTDSKNGKKKETEKGKAAD